jgi:NhaC family Na+:H+ antiporter
MKKNKIHINFGISMIPVIFLIISLTLTVNYFHGEAHMPILATAIVAGAIALASGYSWEELEKGIIDTLHGTLQSMLIFCIIGIVIGMWILGGIVPSMIYYGLKLISPKIFLLTACLICSIVSLATGSSWTTAGTVGIALMGMGHGLGIHLPLVAGAIVSGAYFGDKLSPLSDTTNLAPAVTGIDIFTHIKHMIFTTTPSYIITLILYGILGLKYSSANFNPESLNLILEGLNSSFKISPINLIPPLFIIVMVAIKIPAILGLIISSLLGMLFAIVYQGSTMTDVVGAAHYGYVSNSGIEVMDSLLSGGGLDAMMGPLSLVFMSMSLAGIMEKSGMIDSIAQTILSLSKSVGGLISATVFTCISVNLVTGDQYLSIVFTGKMYKKEYEKQNLHPKNLSRTLEDAGTLTSPLIPWGACGVFMATTLNVSTMEYLPYAFLNLINPIIAIIYGYLGFTIVKLNKEAKSIN